MAKDAAVEMPRRSGARGWARLRRGGQLSVLVGVLVVVVIVATSIGSVTIPFGHTTAIFLNATGLFHFRTDWPSTDPIILFTLRLPRVLAALLVGAALGTAGTLFQGLLRNPLADPFLLGTSSGAALGATAAFLIPGLLSVAWLGFSLVAVLAFLGALVAVVLVYRLATRGGQTPVVTLLLAGVAVGAMVTAVQSLIITFGAHTNNQLAALNGWLTGEITVRTWAQIPVEALLIGLTLIAAFALTPTLDALALGEEMAEHLGIRIERAKLLIVGCAALLVALAVAMSGLVGFVGLVAPHICRLLFGPKHRLLLPASALFGAIFVVLADLIARTIAVWLIGAHIEIPLGVVTALVGGPFFLVLLGRAGVYYRW